VVLVSESSPIPPTPKPQNSQLSDVVEEKEYIPKDITEGDKSLIALLNQAPRFQERILELNRENPAMLALDEITIKTRHPDKITLTVQRLRSALWIEFEAAIINNRMMKVKQIWGGVCGQDMFKTIIEDDVRLSYLLCPPPDYVAMLKEAHHAGLEKMREILSARVVDEEGYLIPKAAEVLLKTYALLDARLKGAIVQRIDQRTLTANLTPDKGVATGQATSMEELNRQLESVKMRLGELTQHPRHPTAAELEESTKGLDIQSEGVVVGGHRTARTNGY
jgi:hypothetical protein